MSLSSKIITRVSSFGRRKDRRGHQRMNDSAPSPHHECEPLARAPLEPLDPSLRRAVEQYMEEQHQLLSALQEFRTAIDGGRNAEQLMCSPAFQQTLARLKASQQQQRELLGSGRGEGITRHFPQLVQQSRAVLDMLSQVTADRPAQQQQQQRRSSGSRDGERRSSNPFSQYGSA